MQTGVDHLDASVPKSTRDDLGATVMSIQAGLGHHDPDWGGWR
jgi:hypothetical protein